MDVLAETGGGPNGATEGLDGSIYIAQNGGRRIDAGATSAPAGIQRIKDGVVSWICHAPVAPNDLCFGPDGRLYVTDPTRRRERDDGRIWRVDVGSGEAELLASVDWYPNGIGFGVEDDALYVASTGERAIRRFAMAPHGLGESEVVIQLPTGYPDGFAFSANGDLVIAAFGSDPPRRDGPGAELQVWSIEGKLLEVLRPTGDHSYSNVALDERRRLIITGSDSGRVMMLDPWPSPGLPLHPFRRAL